MSANNRHMPKVHRLLKQCGYTYDTVERRLLRDVTRDFCGFADLMAFRASNTGNYLYHKSGVLAIQVCSYSTLAAHIHKVTKGDPAPALRTWLLANNRFEVWAFPSPRDGTRKPPKFRQAHLDRDGIIRFSPENTTELAYYNDKLA